MNAEVISRLSDIVLAINLYTTVFLVIRFYELSSKLAHQNLIDFFRLASVAWFVEGTILAIHGLYSLASLSFPVVFVNVVLVLHIINSVIFAMASVEITKFDLYLTIRRKFLRITILTIGCILLVLVANLSTKYSYILVGIAGFLSIIWFAICLSKEVGSSRNLPISVCIYGAFVLIIILAHSDEIIDHSRTSLLMLVVLTISALVKIYFHVSIRSYTTDKYLDFERLKIRDQRALTGEEYVASMVHELGTPAQELRHHIGIASNVLKQTADINRFDLRKELEELLDVVVRILAIVRGTHYTLSVAPELLEKIDSTNLATDSSPIDQPTFIVNSIIESAKMTLRQTLKNSPDVNLKNIGHIYNYSANTRIKADRYEIMQLFINLLKNAYESIGLHKGTVILTTINDRSNNNIVIKVEDDGTGVRPDIYTQVKEPGVTTKSGVGRGYGLSICERIVSKNNGTMDIISLSSDADDDLLAGRHGARVLVTFPMVDAR